MKIHNKKGFTLIEMIVVIAIIAVLAAIAIPVYNGIIDEAIDKTLMASTSNLSTYLAAEMLLEDFDDEHIFTYKKNSSGDKDYFSRYLESNWEIINGSGDEDNANRLGLKNQVSDKVGVVNWPSNLGSGVYSQQALYITTDKGAKYTPEAARTVSSYYSGAVVMWYNADSATKIYLYYVSPDGRQSDKYYVFEKTGN